MPRGGVTHRLAIKRIWMKAEMSDVPGINYRNNPACSITTCTAKAAIQVLFHIG